MLTGQIGEDTTLLISDGMRVQETHMVRNKQKELISKYLGKSYDRVRMPSDKEISLDSINKSVDHKHLSKSQTR